MKRRLPGDFGVVTTPADATAAVLDRSDDCTLDFDESDVWNFAYGSNMSQVRACIRACCPRPECPRRFPLLQEHTSALRAVMVVLFTSQFCVAVNRHARWLH